MKNWRTTLVGAILAAGLCILNLMQNGTIDSKTLLISGGVALLGYLAKDAGISGIEK